MKEQDHLLESHLPKEPVSLPRRRLRERILQKRAEERAQQPPPTVVFQDITDAPDDIFQENDIEQFQFPLQETKAKDVLPKVSITSISSKVINIISTGYELFSNQNMHLSEIDKQTVLAIAVWIYEPRALTALAASWGLPEKSLQTRVWTHLQDEKLRPISDSIFDQGIISTNQPNEITKNMSRMVTIGEINQNLPIFFDFLGVTKEEALLFRLTQQEFTQTEIIQMTGTTLRAHNKRVTSLQEKVVSALHSLNIEPVSSFEDPRLPAAATTGRLHAEKIMRRNFTKSEYVTQFYDNMRRVTEEYKSQDNLVLTEVVSRKDAIKIRGKFPHLLTKKNGRLYISSENLEAFNQRINNSIRVHPLEPELHRIKDLVEDRSEYRKLCRAINAGKAKATRTSTGLFMSSTEIELWRNSKK